MGIILILLGAPGAGKGTQAKMICKSNNLFHFSTGDILRNEVSKQTEVGKEIESIINSGRLVSDKIILKIVDKIISEEISKNNGILFDGFPRNLDQANSFDKLLNEKEIKIDVVLHLLIKKDEIIKRIEKRQTEENRKDDNVEVLKSRIDVYFKETAPLIELYQQKGLLKEFDGMQTIEEVNNNINKSLGDVN